MKKYLQVTILFIISYLFFSVISPQKSLAQGYATCRLDNHGLCHLEANHCDENYVDDCANIEPANCPGQHPCINAIEQTRGCDIGSIDTALGCIPVSDKLAFTQFILRFLLGIAGGIAFILLIYAGILIMTSSGDPRKLAAGKELLMAAISGLLLIVLGPLLLKLVGVDILGIF